MEIQLTSEKIYSLDLLIDQLKDIFLEVPTGIFICDRKGEVKYVNKFFPRVLGGSKPEDSIGLNILELENTKHAGVDTDFRRTLEQGVPFSIERVKYKSVWGKEVYLSVRATPIKERDGTTCGLICFLEDETDKVILEEGLRQKIAELFIIDEVERVLGSTLNLDEILEIILIAVTAGQGLGFNRAFLMLMDEKGAYLEGKMAIGPSNREEAYRIWNNLSQQYQSLEDILKSYRSALEDKNIEVNQIVQKIRVSIREKDNPLIQSVLDKQARYLDENSCSNFSTTNLFQTIGTRKLALAPLISVDKVEGLILADNFVTGKEIKDEDLKLLQIFAHHAGSAIERSRLYQKLEQKLIELEEANRKIAENSQRMLKLERLQAIQEVTFQVAHELRNPMTIIGGFARSILKKTSAQDENFKSLEIIASQTERMEDLLTNFLDYVYVPENKVQELNLNQIIEQSLEMLRGELNEKRIYLVKNLQPQLPKLHLNPELLSSSLLNVLRYMLSNSSSSGSLYITTQTTEGQVSLRLSLMPISSILLPGNSSAFSLASTLIGNMGGSLKYKPEDKARLCLEIIFFPKGGIDGQHTDRG